MTPQHHADRFLAIWQHHRDLPPLQRLQKIASLDGPLAPVVAADFDHTLTAVAEAMQEPVPVVATDFDHTLTAVAETMQEPVPSPHTPSSSPGLTRRSITLAKEMDARNRDDACASRGKPGHDERGDETDRAPALDGFTAAKIEIMAHDLVKAGAFGCEQRAILTLSNRGHGHRDIGRLVARARHRARDLHAQKPKRISR